MATNASTLRDILRVFFSNKVFFIVLPIALTISAYIGYELKTPVYEASVRMFVKGEKKTEAEFYVGVNSLSAVAEHLDLVKSNAVLSRVVESLKLYERPIDYERKYAPRLRRAFIDSNLKNEEAQPDIKTRFAMAMGELNSNISVVPAGESNMFNISADDFDPNLARKIANSVSRSYIIFDLEQHIEELKLKYGEKYPEVLQLKGYIEDFKKTLDGEPIPDIIAYGPASVKIISQAQDAFMVRRVNKNILLGFSFFTGIFLAMVFAAIFEYTNQAFKTPKSIVDYLNLHLLGSVPKRKSKEKFLINGNDPQNTDYFRSVRSLTGYISLLRKDNKIKTLLITDVEGSQETAIINANIGISFAQNTGRKVLIIDADLRAFSLSMILNGTGYNEGLANILEGKSSVINAIKGMGSNLDFLPSGETSLNPGILLESSEMSELINKAEEAYDLIIINCPNLKNYTDPAIISSFADGVILVINEGKVRRQVLDNAINLLNKRNVNIIGVIFNNRTYVIPEIIYKLT